MMPPKKRGRDREGENGKIKKLRLESSEPEALQAEQELFVLTFEKPTQIYRYLRSRNLVSPIFLYRTLRYMKPRMSRTNHARKTFKVDSLLERKEKSEQSNHAMKFMTLLFLGFYHNNNGQSIHCQEPVTVEVLVTNICHKKRKDVSSPVMQVSMGSVEVPINPSEEKPPSTVPTISVPTASFSLNNGNLNSQSYVLLVRVSCSQPSSESESGNDPCRAEEKRLFGTELVIYDRYSRCLLPDADYTLNLQENNPSTPSKMFSPRKRTWESVHKDHEKKLVEGSASYKDANEGPILKVRLQWQAEAARTLVERPALYEPLDMVETSKEDTKEHLSYGSSLNDCLCEEKSSASNNKSNQENTNLPSKAVNGCRPAPYVEYQFMFRTHSRLMMQGRKDFHCPWCVLHCMTLFGLMHHLRLCHPRFLFTHVTLSHGSRINVTINEHYDGTYSGNPYDLVTQPQDKRQRGTFGRNVQIPRSNKMAVMVWRPKRHRLNQQMGHQGTANGAVSDLMDFDPPHDMMEHPRTFTEHHRLYHHTRTCLPIHPKDLDLESDEEINPEWLRTKTLSMIDDFTDVNEGEKEVMKLWNIHVMKHNFVGDCQIPLALSMFLDVYGEEILQRNLCRNFLLHTVNLYHFGLITPSVVLKIIIQVQSLMRKPEAQRVYKDSWVKQLKTPPENLS